MKYIPKKSTLVLLALSLALAAGWSVDRWESTLVIQSLESDHSFAQWTPAGRYPRYFDFAFSPLDDAARQARN